MCFCLLLSLGLFVASVLLTCMFGFSLGFGSLLLSYRSIVWTLDCVICFGFSWLFVARV